MAKARTISDRAEQFFIDGEWVASGATRHLDVINPADESVICKVALGSAEDLDRAVKAARAAFPAYAATSVAERQALLSKIVEAGHYRFGRFLLLLLF